jgi:hypothetical protein
MYKNFKRRVTGVSMFFFILILKTIFLFNSKKLFIMETAASRNLTNLDLGFILDCTASMDVYIDHAKEVC